MIILLEFIKTMFGKRENIVKGKTYNRIFDFLEDTDGSKTMGVLDILYNENWTVEP